jgi:hypothetical protein
LPYAALSDLYQAEDKEDKKYKEEKKDNEVPEGVIDHHEKEHMLIVYYIANVYSIRLRRYCAVIENYKLVANCWRRT